MIHAFEIRSYKDDSNDGMLRLGLTTDGTTEKESYQAYKYVNNPSTMAKSYMNGKAYWKTVSASATGWGDLIPEGNSTDFNLVYGTRENDDPGISGNWTDLATIQNVNSAKIYADPGAQVLYRAWISDGQLMVSKWSGSQWTQVGDVISTDVKDDSPLDLTVASGKLYVSYLSEAGNPRCSVYGAGGWSSTVTSEDLASEYLELVNGSGVYLSYLNTDSKLVLYDVQNNKKIVEQAIDASTGAPSVLKKGDLFYVLHSGESTVLKTYSVKSSQWSTLKTFDTGNTTEHAMKIERGKLYILAAGSGSGKKNVLSIYDGVQWVDGVMEGSSDVSDSDLMIYQDEVYVSYLRGNTRILQRRQGASSALISEEYSGQTSNQMLNSSSANIGTALYTSTLQGGTFTLQGNALTVPKYHVSIDLPDGYTDTVFYVDGEAFEGTITENTLQVDLPHGNGRIGQMFYYDASGVPKGMYIWRLDFDGSKYQVTALQELENLISYVGFSARVTGKTGIRIQSSINKTARDTMASSGISGYKLLEYGHIAVPDFYRSRYALRKFESYVEAGVAYPANTDQETEDKNGNILFSNVTVDVPVSIYKRDVAYSAYAILENNGEKFLIYGPVRTRSLYTMAESYMKRYQSGDAYEFAKAIVDAVN